MRYVSVVSMAVVLLAAGGCSHETTGPAPTVQEVKPKLLCNAQADVDLTVLGADFSPLPSDILGESPKLLMPVVSLEGQGGPFDLSTDAQSGYLIRPTTEITARIPAATLPTPASGESYVYDAVVTNPNFLQGRLAQAVTNLPPPSIESVSVEDQYDSGLEPPEICIEQGDRTITIHGTDFHDRDGEGNAAKPAVDFVDADGDSHAIPPDQVTYVDAQTLEVLIKQGELPEGTYTLVVTNPEAGSCMAELPDALRVVPAPTITSVDALCADAEGALTVHGTGFLPGATVTVGGQTYTDVTVSDDGTTITVPGVSLGLGDYDVTVTNKDGCSVTAPASLEVLPAPSVFDVDPDVVYSGVNTPVTIRGKDFAEGVTVVLYDASGQPVGNPIEPNSISPDGRKLEVTIPAGLAAGTYSVTVQLGGCSTALQGALEVVDELTVRVCSITPPFGWTGGDTPVTIRGGDCTGTTDFAATPRAWIVLADSLTPLRNVSFVSATELHAVVPAGIPEGTYPLMVQNPDGAIGLLSDAFDVVANPVPLIENVTPAAGTTSSDQNVTIFGQNFRDPVEVTLVSETGQTYALANATVVSSTEVTATVPIATDLLPLGTYLVHLVDLDDGTYGPDWSSFVITGPSAKLDQFVETSAPLPEAREGHGMLPGAVTNQSRFLYVIGGDGGAGTLYDTVVANQLDAFGNLSSTWQVLRNRLPAPRTGLAATAAGHFLYVAGGRDDAGTPTNEVLRAEILLPADAPQNVEPSLDFVETGSGLDPGTYYYRVAAVMAPTDPTNPSGEGLPSDEVVIRAPSAGTLKWIVTLTWDPVQRADHYRIYRNPTAGGTSGEEVLLADNVTDTTFVDEGTASPGTETPMPQGSTGVWTVAATFATARADAAAAVAHEASSGTAYLYVVGGQTTWPGAAGDALDTYEYAPLSQGGGVVTLPFARDDVNRLVRATTRATLTAADHANASVIPADAASFLFLAGGSSGALNGYLADVEVAQVGVDGALVWADANAKPGQSRDAPAGLLVFNSLYIFGGLAPSGPLDTANFGELASAGDGTFINFSSSSKAMTVPHALGAAAFTVGHAYISGGIEAGTLSSPTPTAVVEWARFAP